MKRPLVLLLFSLLTAPALFADPPEPRGVAESGAGRDSTGIVCIPGPDGKMHTRQPQFLALGAVNGAVLHTNTYVSDNGGPQGFTAMNVKYGILSKGDRWEDIAYGMPYGGVGVYWANYYGITNGSVGTPVSLFVFQGGHLARLSPRLVFNYEWELGLSSGWEAYDPFDNPANIAIGSTVNVHIAFDFYFKWYLSPVFDLNFGVTLSHFSNGDSRLPNAGLNHAALSVALVTNFNRRELACTYDPTLTPPPFDRRIDHDISLLISSRQKQFDTISTGLPSPFVDRKFKVLGVSYAMLFANAYKYKWGPGVDLVYDESSGATAWRQYNPADGKYYDRTRLGQDRVSLGLCVKGELTMPRYSIFANVGWNAIWGNRDDDRLYQTLGLKVYLKDNLFGTFGIRATHFSSASYLYWSLGYTIGGRHRGPRQRI